MDIEILLNNIYSTQNEVRQQAESNLIQMCSSDPASTFTHFINIASNKVYSQSIRQLSLLCLKKFITMFWSAGFPSYVGPPGVGDTAKIRVREGLLKMLMNEIEYDNKILKSVIYCIVQICAVEFPDEWPNLIDDVSEIILKQESVHGVELLTDLVQDIMSTDMFFRKEIGEKIVLLVCTVLNGSFQYTMKLNALKLYERCLVHLSSSYSYMETEPWINIHFNFIYTEFDTFIATGSSGFDLHDLILRSHVFKCLGKLFHITPKSKKNLANWELRTESWVILVKYCSQFYLSILEGKKGTEDPLFDPIQDCVLNLVEYLQALHPSQLDILPALEVAGYMEVLCVLPDDPYDDYNFNEFVSKETGLSATYSVRDELGQFFSTVSGQFHSNLVDFVINNCLHLRTQVQSRQEALLFMLQELSSNDIGMNLNQPQEILRFFDLLLSGNCSEALVVSRLLLVVPKFLENNMEIIPNVKGFVKEFIEKSFRLCISSQNTFLLSSMMISFTNYSSFAELSSVLDEETSLFVQTSLLQGIELLSLDSEEDCMGLILECLHECLRSWSLQQNLAIKKYELQLLLKLSSKEPSNVRIIIESVRCLSLLLKNLSEDEYLKMCDICMSSFLTVLESYLSTSQSFSPLVTLTLEFLGVFMKTPPREGELPDSVTERVLPILFQLIRGCNDEDMLASVLTTFNYLVFNCNKLYAQENAKLALNIIFSSEKQFMKHLDVGPLILLVVKLNDTIQTSTLNEILSHTVPKILDKKMPSVYQHYLLIICELLLSCLNETLRVLFSYNLNNNENLMNKIMIDLFEIFETDRNEEMIKEIILVFNSIFFTDDTRINNLCFEGSHDNILSFKEKTIKLYAGELVIQIKNENMNGSDMSSEYSAFDSFDDENNDTVLFLRRSISLSIRELIQKFFVDVNEQSKHVLEAVFPHLSTDEQIAISTVLSS